MAIVTPVGLVTGELKSVQSADTLKIPCPAILIPTDSTIKPISGPAYFSIQLLSETDYTQWAFKDASGSVRGFFGYVGTSYVTTSRRGHFEISTPAGFHSIYFRPGEGADRVIFNSIGTIFNTGMLVPSLQIRLPQISFDENGLVTPFVLGDFVMFTDSLNPVVGQPVVGGGSTPVVAWYNGTDWIVVAGTNLPPAVSSGTFSPTFSDLSGTTTLISYDAQWSRIGNVVTVSGLVRVSYTVPGSPTLIQFLSDLPIASVCAEEQCGGTGVGLDSTIGVPVRIFSDTSGSAEFDFIATPIMSGNIRISYTYTYQII